MAKRVWDYMNEEIVPREQKKVPLAAPFQRRNIGTVTGKSIKWYKLELVPKLRVKIKNLQAEIRRLRKTRDGVKKEKSVLKKKEFDRKNQMRKRRMRKKTISRIKLWKQNNVVLRKVNQKLNEKINLKRVINSKIYSGATMFPLILKEAEQRGIHPNVFAVMVIIYHYEWFTPKDGLRYGYNNKSMDYYLKKIVSLGYANKTKSVKAWTYYLNEEGKNMVRMANNRIKERSKEMHSHFDGLKEVSGNSSAIKIRIKKTEGNDYKPKNKVFQL